MREKMVCRFCELQTTHQTAQLKGGLRGRRSFAVVGASPHYAPDRPFRLEHLALDLTVDPRVKKLVGFAKQKVKVIASEQKFLRLDQIGLKIQRVTVQKEEMKFDLDGNSLLIHFKKSPQVDELLEVEVAYSTENPQRGIYFTGPDSDYPTKPYQVWTQGQDEDSRYWIPTLDYPNQKITSEIQVVVPKGFTAISNGALLSQENLEQGTRFHYRLGMPHVTYLISLVVGEFHEWKDEGPRGLPVQYFVALGREADGKRAFHHTPLMIEAFEKKTGIPYPYEKYSQVAVQDFIFGGMENTSSTTQTELTLHDERAHLDFSSDPLVAHELAHQWFGDLVTCRDWSNGWLNEGFATFMERVWVESDQSSAGGLEEAKYYSYQDFKEHQAEDSGRYRRPIVCNTYIEPIDLFDTHLYQKGGLVLNLLRSTLGEASFWKSIQLYLTRHRGQNVETLDLIRAIEDATGRNLRRFFDEWVFSAGYPEFEVSYTWHEEKKLTEWVIEQKQTQGQTSFIQDGAITPLFHLPVHLEMTLATGEVLKHVVEIGELRDRIFLPAPSKPVRVRFDPGNTIPKIMKFPRSKEMLLNQLQHDPDCMGRIEAAQELGKISDSEVVQALSRSVAIDPFWGVQAEIAKVLAEIRVDASRDGLIEALKVQHPKARRAIVNALGTFRDEKAIHALKGVAEKDPSYFVEAEAVTAWTTASLIPQKKTSPEELESFLIKKLAQGSFREVIRSAALNALADLPGIGSGDRPHVLATIMEWAHRGKPMDARTSAIRALGKVLKIARPLEKSQILDLLETLGDENNFRLRMQMISVLEDTGLGDAVPLLNRIRILDTDGRVKRGVQRAIETLVSSQGLPDTVSHLKSALEKLEEDYRKLRSKVEAKGITDF